MQVNKDWRYAISKTHDEIPPHGRKHPGSANNNNNNNDESYSKTHDFVSSFWASVIASLEASVVAGFTILLKTENDKEECAMIVRRRLIYHSRLPAESDNLEVRDLNATYLEIFPSRSLYEANRDWFDEQVSFIRVEAKFPRMGKINPRVNAPEERGITAMTDLEREFWGGCFVLGDDGPDNEWLTYTRTFDNIKRGYPSDLKFRTIPLMHKVLSDHDTSETDPSKYNSPTTASYVLRDMSDKDKEDAKLMNPVVVRPVDLFKWLTSKKTLFVARRYQYV
jgi:hypothetical protein